MSSIVKCAALGCLFAGLALPSLAAESCPANMDCEGYLSGVVPSAATVVNFEQKLDEANAANFGVSGKPSIPRRYLRYVPKDLPAGPVPLLILFHGANTEAETLAWSDNAGDFERLADKQKFVLVYANAFSPKSDKGWKYPGVWKACRAESQGEAPDVSYVREIVAQLVKAYKIDRKRIYAGGISNGGGMAFGLALEAPDLVSAIAAAVPVPYSPTEPGTCVAKPGHDKVSIMMMASTDDPLLDYTGRGMERIRDQWRTALGITGKPVLERLPDTVSGDSMNLPSSHIELYRYPAAKKGSADLWFYKMVGAGHMTPRFQQLDASIWGFLGKRNQDANFAGLVWGFVSRHAKQP